jgi:hypothetical protein
MLYRPSVRSRSAPQDAPSSPCYQGLFGCPDFESATGSSGWCSCSHNVARIRAAWCPLRPARSLRLRPSAGGGTWPWSRAACGRCGDALLVAAGRGSLATEELGGDVARHAADSLPSVSYPVCTGGERACPREDCGGTDGYRHLLEVLADPTHEDRADLKRWAGRRYDSEKFDPAVANRALRKLRKRPSRGRRGHDARP